MPRPVYYVGDHTILTELCYGPKIFLDTRDIVQNHIMYYGFWEHWVSKAFMEYVKPGMTVLDIGAHCGYYTLLAALLAGNSGHIYAFEPNKRMVKNATMSMLMNDYNQVHWHAVGLSDRAETMNLVVPESGGGSLTTRNDPAYQRVETVSLSDFMPELKADVVKIDVDGWEPRILPCLYNLIDRSDRTVVFMEYCPQLWRMHGFEPKECLSPFVDKGFDFWVLEHSGDRTLISLEHLIAYDLTAHLDLLIEKT